MTRRQMLGWLARGVPALAVAPVLLGAQSRARKRLGVCTYSYHLHWEVLRRGQRNGRFTDTVGFLDYCHQLGAGGAQIAIDARQPDEARRVRAKAEALQMYIEGQVSLPGRESDLARFEAEIRAAREAGAAIVRTAMLSGRRYETFASAEAFRRFTEQSWQSLKLAEPVVRRHRMRLAIENHKDRRAAELLELLRRIDSEHVGACVDFGNNLALLEEPMSVIEALAPYAVSTHVKDMAVQEYAEGFLLSEVPLGQGALDLERMFTVLEKANPSLQWNLEMITRDPLPVPCLTPGYWATLAGVPAPALAATLTWVRRHAAKQPLPRASGLNLERQLASEDANVRASFAYARQLRAAASPHTRSRRFAFS
ncbi:MAG: TIM barrel protein [Verrucomicrobia bacterium]|nr:TIM barrel protein [Verrucomicrobiota bacterium]